jgi:glucose/arabinose dehydrogenase
VKTLSAGAALAAGIILMLSVPVLAAIQLVPVASGLSRPVFVGHAGDGSNRLFIVEQAGVIKVLQPDTSTPTVFLDIHTLVLSTGNEQGLLGLAFHPDYETNGRFFVFYTRAGGEIVVAEYHVSADPNAADTSGTIILTIPHPTYTNHNGGMIAFAPDGLLHIGVGDGGSGNDPSNNAQNRNVLLGKILRLNINPPPGTGPYAIPDDNPFRNVPNTRPEIFAYGMRNPWRFSFDRLTGNQWVADVGQGAKEEVDTPITGGGNYGWRVYEGTSCTGTDQNLCDPANYILPLFDYGHSLGRCSITGGYVYRGSQNSFANGRYIFGDYCTGEIFEWDGSTQTLVMDTALNISSFGEDEAGEIYVVGLGGTVHRLADPGSPCSYSISPTSQNFPAAGGAGNVGVTSGQGCPWSSVSNASWIRISGTGAGSGNGSVDYAVDPNTSTTSRNGNMQVAGQTFTVNQSGTAPTCTYSISPTRQTFGNAGGTGSVAVSTSAGCSWTAISNASWMSVTGGVSGTGPGTVTYSVDSFSGRGARNGKITIAGLTFSVKQSK